MDERDLEAEEALVRLRVDHLGARVGEAGELGADVLDLVGDVVHTRPAFREEPADRRLLAERRNQFDPARSDEDGRRLDPLRVHAAAMLDLCAEEPLVRVHGLVEVVHGDAEMVDAAGGHGSMLQSR